MKALNTQSSIAPLIYELVPPPDVEQAFLRLANRRHCLFLDSARRDPALGRYSFLAAEPFDFLEAPADGAGSFATLENRLAGMTATNVPGLPPWQGGAAGLLSYDLGRELERLPRPRVDEFAIPALAVGLYDVVVAFDHEAKRAWIISQGLPEIDPERRARRAEARLAEMRDWLAGPPSAGPSLNPPIASAVDRAALAPQFAVGGIEGLSSNFSAAPARSKATTLPSPSMSTIDLTGSPKPRPPGNRSAASV